MSQENADRLAKSYDPVPIEDAWYRKWIDADLFHAEVDLSRNPFSIVIPPPNVTGSLHLGHALDNTLQDIVCRYHRMLGDNVVWIPGTDHAGIATQNVVERELAKQGLTRESLGREAFIEKVWEWKEKYGSQIISQLKKLGASCDWARERFTMDEGLSRAVRSVFVRLYHKGLIYKGKYIINWCPRCQTALSDLEVEHEEEKGKLYEVAYRFADGEGSVRVMTTRPETILGDVAIAVHPRDERNRHLVGRKVVVPIVGRVIPVIEDNMVDPEFGTGCVKITPAHDPNDYLVGQRHRLEQIQVIDDRGIMNENAGKYAGLDRFRAREAVLRDLESEGALLGVKDLTHSIGHCYRCHTIVEPYLSEQWFVKTKPLADAGVKAVKEGRIRWIPDQWVNVYYQWMENIRDWCISRQLWWGHRIPAWTCEDCGHLTVSEEDPTQCEACGSSRLIQDQDVLDTWFSSALWPFSTLGWPEGTPELSYFYPTSLLVTGFDIIFFWVARMIMMGLEFMGDVPFRHVYIHALVRDEKGQKMSKSKGNVIDPLDVIERSGADALRLTLAALTLQGRDIFLSVSKIDTYRFFLNKLWNASRFALLNLDELGEENSFSLSDEKALRLHDRWILSRLNQVIEETTEDLNGYFFGEAARLLYDFIWGELCDWYLEMAKPALKGEEGEERRKATQAVLKRVFREILLLLHPFVPFVTEELWHAFEFGGKFIEQTSWPAADSRWVDPRTTEEMALFQDFVRSIRNLRAEAHLVPQTWVPLVIFRSDEASAVNLLSQNADLAKLLARVKDIQFYPTTSEKPSQCLAAVLTCGDVFLKVSGLVDIDKEIERLESERVKLENEIQKSENKLSNGEFLSKAPAEVVEKERAVLNENQAKKKRLLENLKTLKE